MSAVVDRPVAARATTGRDRYIDSLRALALIRVMTYHVVGWWWLPIVYPSMGIMFALAGSLVAASLDRSPGNPWRVLRKRVVRLLPPLWLFGAVCVPAMLLLGWTHTATVGQPLSWRTMLFWVLPISDPPGSAYADDWVVPLWYIRAYLWFLLLSPAALWTFRHWPRRTLALPLVAVALHAFGLLPFDGRTGEVLLSLATFGACWLLGFAHHDHRIRALPARLVLPLGLACMASGVAWALVNPQPDTGWAIDDIPLANALYCVGAVAVLLRLYPDFSWMQQRPVLDRLVSVINSRAMTIYLWGNVAIFLSNPVLDLWPVTRRLDDGSAWSWVAMYVVSWLLVGVAVLLFGWVEDLAARRPVRVNPWPRRASSASSAASAGARVPRQRVGTVLTLSVAGVALAGSGAAALVVATGGASGSSSARLLQRAPEPPGRFAPLPATGSWAPPRASSAPGASPAPVDPAAMWAGVGPVGVGPGGVGPGGVGPGGVGPGGAPVPAARAGS